MDYSFDNIIQKVNLIDSSPLKDEIKLRRSGELFYQGSLGILAKAEAVLDDINKQDIDLTDTFVDKSFSDFLVSFTQQSISTNFLAKFLQPQPRADYYRETTKSIKSLSVTEALDELAEDLLESEIFTLAHDENIEAWIELVERHLKLYPEINILPDIARLNELTLAQAFIAALFGSFKLEHNGGFYEINQLKLFR